MFTQVVLLFLLVQALGTSNTKGIYRTQDDFNQHRLLFEAPASSHKVRIRAHEFMVGPRYHHRFQGDRNITS